MKARKQGSFCISVGYLSSAHWNARNYSGCRIFTTEARGHGERKSHRPRSGLSRKAAFQAIPCVSLRGPSPLITSTDMQLRCSPVPSKSNAGRLGTLRAKADRICGFRAVTSVSR
jgi:hypothetical protein